MSSTSKSIVIYSFLLVLILLCYQAHVPIIMIALFFIFVSIGLSLARRRHPVKIPPVPKTRSVPDALDNFGREEITSLDRPTVLRKKDRNLRSV